MQFTVNWGTRWETHRKYIAKSGSPGGKGFCMGEANSLQGVAARSLKKKEGSLH